MKKLLVPFLFVGLLASCSSDDVVKPYDPAQPDLVKVPLIISSMSINQLPKSIGLASFDDSEKIPSLVEYLAPSESSEAVSKNSTKSLILSWRPKDKAEEIYFDNGVSEYKLFAFSPYDKEFKLDTPIDIKAQEYSEDDRSVDYYYGFTSGLSLNNPEANLKLQRLYSYVTLVIKRLSDSNFKGDGKLDNIAFYGTGIFQSAKASFKNFTNVQITNILGTNVDSRFSTKIQDVTLPLSGGVSANKFLMIPASSTYFAEPMNIELTFDGTHKLLGQITKDNGLKELLSGKKYQIEIKINETSFDVLSVRND